jgi:hypothetical protein
MWLLVVFLGLIGFFHFVASISLLDRKRNITLVALAMAAIPLIHHPFALQTNFTVITEQLGNLSFVSGLVALEIAVIFLTIYYSSDIIQGHFSQNRKFKRFFSLIPSVFFVTGILLTQLYIFNEISGLSYFWLTIAISLLLFGVVWLMAFLAKGLSRDWTLRLELKTLLSFILIMGAMLLPIFFQNVTLISQQYSEINYKLSSMIIGSVLIICSLGYINHKFNITKSIWNRFIKY